jgi:hypothetical protein
MALTWRTESEGDLGWSAAGRLTETHANILWKISIKLSSNQAHCFMPIILATFLRLKSGASQLVDISGKKQNKT